MSALDTLITNLQTIQTETNNKIIPGNIKSGVTIFNVQGTVEELNGETITVTPTATQQVITPSQGYNGITQITIAGDENLLAGNIKAGVTIFGVTGTYAGDEDISL